MRKGTNGNTAATVGANDAPVIKTLLLINLPPFYTIHNLSVFKGYGFGRTNIGTFFTFYKAKIGLIPILMC